MRDDAHPIRRYLRSGRATTTEGVHQQPGLPPFSIARPTRLKLLHDSSCELHVKRQP